MKKQPKRAISVSMEPELYDALHKIAKQEYRTISGQILFWVEQHLREYQKEQPASNKEN